MNLKKRIESNKLFKRREKRVDPENLKKRIERTSHRCRLAEFLPQNLKKRIESTWNVAAVPLARPTRGISRRGLKEIRADFN